MMITLKKDEVNKHTYKAYWTNGVFVGDVMMDVDGVYKYFPADAGNGGWDQEFLQVMTDKLRELNIEWEKEGMYDTLRGYGKHDTQQGKPL